MKNNDDMVLLNMIKSKESPPLESKLESIERKRGINRMKDTFHQNNRKTDFRRNKSKFNSSFEEKSLQEFYCNHCKIQCSSKSDYEHHLSGKKHLLATRKPKSSNQDSKIAKDQAMMGELRAKYAASVGLTSVIASEVKKQQQQQQQQEQEPKLSVSSTAATGNSISNGSNNKLPIKQQQQLPQSLSILAKFIQARRNSDSMDNSNNINDNNKNNNSKLPSKSPLKSKSPKKRNKKKIIKKNTDSTTLLVNSNSQVDSVVTKKEIPTKTVPTAIAKPTITPSTTVIEVEEPILIPKMLLAKDILSGVNDSTSKDLRSNHEDISNVPSSSIPPKLVISESESTPSSTATIATTGPSLNTEKGSHFLAFLNSKTEATNSKADGINNENEKNNNKTSCMSPSSQLFAHITEPLASKEEVPVSREVPVFEEVPESIFERKIVLRERQNDENSKSEIIIENKENGKSSKVATSIADSKSKRLLEEIRSPPRSSGRSRSGRQPTFSPVRPNGSSGPRRNPSALFSVELPSSSSVPNSSTNSASASPRNKTAFSHFQFAAQDDSTPTINQSQRIPFSNFEVLQPNDEQKPQTNNDSLNTSEADSFNALLSKLASNYSPPLPPSHPKLPPAGFQEKIIDKHVNVTQSTQNTMFDESKNLLAFITGNNNTETDEFVERSTGTLHKSQFYPTSKTLSHPKIEASEKIDEDGSILSKIRDMSIDEKMKLQKYLTNSIEISSNHHQSNIKHLDSSLREHSVLNNNNGQLTNDSRTNPRHNHNSTSSSTMTNREPRGAIAWLSSSRQAVQSAQSSNNTQRKGAPKGIQEFRRAPPNLQRDFPAMNDQRPTKEMIHALNRIKQMATSAKQRGFIDFEALEQAMYTELKIVRDLPRNSDRKHYRACVARFNEFICESEGRELPPQQVFGDDFDDTEECSICFDIYTPQNPKMVLECGHYFHSKCLSTYFHNHPKLCPMCRKDVN
eukprot:TRINITY_DN364_c0_g1_i1.p1 TRINITY_DN364_c0_g1~~TRINITY_DN364_c0_g1_i1.p1  ORF type:complete len:1087 (+),score=287.15 TRINITY_DN364_c0_g1_i1:357-3263(+)